MKYLDDWDYTYDAVAAPATIGNFNLANALTVQQQDEITGDPADPETRYAEVNFAEEKYAFGIGLVYSKFFHSEFQRINLGDAGYYADGSYGVTLTMIDHN